MDYQDAFADRFEACLRFSITQACEINAVRFITKNILTIAPQAVHGIEWNNQHLVLPLQSPVGATDGSTIEVRFTYSAGGSIESLSASLRCELVA